MRRKFKSIIGYTEQDFLPHQATAFSMKLCHKLFIECFSITRCLPNLLNEEEALGAHTSVILLISSLGFRYFWCHKAYRPFGDKVPLQCPDCFAIRTLSFSSGSEEKYTVRCRCGWRKECVPKISPALYPEGGIGWARTILYGTADDVERVSKAPREMYDTHL